MKILAIDPATLTGFAWGDGKKIYSGVWSLGSDPHAGSRMLRLAEEIRALHRSRGFEAIAFEEASYGAGARKGKGIQWSAIVLHNKLRGAIEMVAAELLVKCFPVAPATIKAFVAGNGKATKADVIRAVELHFGIVAQDDNEADAIAILFWAMAHPEGFIGAKAVAKKQKAARKKDAKLF